MIEKKVPVYETVYVAVDGKEFASDAECRKYENVLVRERTDNALEFLRGDHPQDFIRVECDNKNGELPLKYWMYFTDDNEYIWIKPLTQSAVDAIDDVQDFRCNNNTKAEIGRWYNLDIYDGDVYVEPLSRCVEDFTHMLGKLGMTPAQAFGYEERRNNDARKWWEK